MSTSAAPTPAASTSAAPPLDDAPLPIPNLALPQLAFNLSTPRPDLDPQQAKTALLNGIEHDRPSPSCPVLTLSPPHLD